MARKNANGSAEDDGFVPATDNHVATNKSGERVETLDATPASALVDREILPGGTEATRRSLRSNDVVRDATSVRRPRSTGIANDGSKLSVLQRELKTAEEWRDRLARRILDEDEDADLAELKREYARAKETAADIEKEVEEAMNEQPGDVLKARVLEDKFVSSGVGLEAVGMRSKLHAGKVVDSLNYDFEHLRRQGVKLEPLDSSSY